MDSLTNTASDNNSPFRLVIIESDLRQIESYYRLYYEKPHNYIMIKSDYDNMDFWGERHYNTLIIAFHTRMEAEKAIPLHFKDGMDISQYKGTTFYILDVNSEVHLHKIWDGMTLINMMKQ